MPGAILEALEGLHQQWRGTGNEQAHVGAMLLRESGIVEQAGVIGRHAHHHRALRQMGPGKRGRERRRPAHLRTRQQHATQRHEQAVDVEDRQAVEQSVRVGEAPEIDQHLGIGLEVAVSQHDALGQARRAGGIEQAGKVVVIARDRAETVLLPIGQLGKAAPALAVHHMEMIDAELPRQLLHHRLLARIADDQCRLRIAEEIFHFPSLVGRVERMEHEAALQAGEIEAQITDGLLHLDADPVPRLRTERGDGIGHLRHAAADVLARIELAIHRGQQFPLGGLGKYVFD